MTPSMPIRLLLAVVVGLSIPTAVSAQNYHFSTLAGLPTAGAGDGTGDTAQVNYPGAAAADAAGNVYFVDTLSSTVRRITPAGVVTTIAGKAGAHGSVDGTGAAARFDRPTGIAVGTDGTIYVAGNRDHTIRKITTGGVVTTLAGLAYTPGSAGGTGSTARFNYPGGVAVDASNNVYVSDTGNHLVRVVNPGGTAFIIAGTALTPGSADGTGGAARFNGPTGIVVNAAGTTMWVADTGNFTIRQVTSSAVVTTVAGLAGNAGVTDGVGTSARFLQPAGMTMDVGGTIYVTDVTGFTVRRLILPSGTVTTFAGLGGVSGFTDATGPAARFSVVAGVAVKPDGSAIVASDSGNNAMRAITPAGVVTTLAGATAGALDGTGTLAKLDGPYGLGVAADGTVWVADTGNHQIRRVTGTGITTSYAGAADVSGTTDGFSPNARFNRPRAVAVASDGTLFIADNINHTIRKITTSAIVSTLAGLAGSSGSLNGTGAGALFNRPGGIAVGPTGTLYVADSYNHTIRAVTQAGVVTTLAGSAGISGTVDGTGAAARFTFPQGIAANASGVFVADTLNHTIRKVTYAGVVTTVAGTPGVLGASDGNGSAARFYQPTGIAAAADNTLFVADSMNFTIRRISPTGDVDTIGGEPGERGSLSGVGPESSFNMPTGIALGRHGTLYVAEQGGSAIRVGIIADTTFVDNGGFDTNSTGWSKFATPDISYMPNSVTSGAYQFHRNAPPAGTSNQAVTFQETGVPIPKDGALEMKVKLRNTDTIAKRISIVVHDASFADLTVCTFWLPPNTPPFATYTIRTHTTQPWASATVSFYAASANPPGTGDYQLDDVSYAFLSAGMADRTTCADPTRPTAPGGADGSNLVTNGAFTSTLTPWFTFGTITSQLTSGVFEFVKLNSAAPAGVVSQQTGQPIAAGRIITAGFQLGNSSAVRKRVTVIMHDSDFSDLSACTFYLAPLQPLSSYVYRSFTTKAWTNASISVYPSTIGAEQWIRLDNVTMFETPSQTIVGTECLEPASGSADATAAAARSNRVLRGVSFGSGPALPPGVSRDEPGSRAGVTTDAESRVVVDEEWRATGFRREPDDANDSVATWIGAATPGTVSTLEGRPFVVTNETAVMQFDTWLTAMSASARIDVSTDGATWVTIAAVPSSDTWYQAEVDLSAYVGSSITVRFRFEGAQEPPPGAADRWLLRPQLPDRH